MFVYRNDRYFVSKCVVDHRVPIYIHNLPEFFLITYFYIAILKILKISNNNHMNQYMYELYEKYIFYR